MAGTIYSNYPRPTVRINAKGKSHFRDFLKLQTKLSNEYLSRQDVKTMFGDGY
jgi:hypothetical protein